jgi:hypothetical protein
MKKIKMKNIGTVDSFEDDVLKSILFIYGDEGTGTTTLAMSMVDVVDSDKKIYVLVTEPMHNETGIIHHHFGDEMEAGRFVLPSDSEGNPVTLIDKASILSFVTKAKSADDIGCLVIDALDTVRVILAESSNSNFAMKQWSDANTFIIKTILKPMTELGIPVVGVMKEKEAIKVNPDNSVTKLGYIEPNISSPKIQRWCSFRLRCTKVGEYEVMKSKGGLEKGDRLKFGFSGKKRIGDWLSTVFDKARG